MDEKDLLIQKLMDRITVLERLVEQQAAQIAALEKRLGKNSSNSSKPPSLDDNLGSYEKNQNEA